MKRVLLVDDDPISNFINRLVVEEVTSCEVVIAENGQEAIDIIQNCSTQEDYPELILLDLNMPVMDGHEFLNEFEKVSEKPKVKIIVLTSSNAKTDVDKAQKKKIQGYVIKPLTSDKLQEVLDNDKT